MALQNLGPDLLLAATRLNGEGWRQFAELGLALLLSALIGLEREIRQKNAGLRTHTLVGLGAALFVLISKYGFTDVLEPGRIVLDPSRMAAQIVTGVGFLGAGLIFVRRDSVRGLTTAAAVWITAAVGAAAGAGLPLLATVTTALYLVFVAVLFPFLSRRLPRSSTAISSLRVRYQDGQGVLRRLLEMTTSRGFTIDEIATDTRGHWPTANTGVDTDTGASIVEVTLHLHGRSPIHELVAVMIEVDGIAGVTVEDANVGDE